MKVEKCFFQGKDYKIVGSHNNNIWSVLSKEPVKINSDVFFEYSEKDKREQAKIDRTAAELDNARTMAAQAAADQTSALTGAIGGITSSLASAYSPGK